MEKELLFLKDFQISSPRPLLFLLLISVLSLSAIEKEVLLVPLTEKNDIN